MILEDRLNSVLQVYSNQPVIWIDPIVLPFNKLDNDSSTHINDSVSFDQLLSKKNNYSISSPPQFGASSLARKIVLEKWKKEELYVYIDSTKTSKKKVKTYIKEYLKEVKAIDNLISGFIFDNWNVDNESHPALVSFIIETYPNSHVIVFEETDNDKFFAGKQSLEKYEFEPLFLVGLPKEKVRELVKGYNKVMLIDDEDKVVEKVAGDLEALNVHRTPLNCITLLKVSEKFFDVNPVNRSRMLELILIILFDLDDIPTYSSKPDVKDVEHILGNFAEVLIRNQRLKFTENEFSQEFDSFCKKQFLTVDRSIVFTTLLKNNIIIQISSHSFIFKYNYWLFFFAAKRMNLNEEFKQWVLASKNYNNFPEVMEFYTGIDRNKNDILSILLEDLRETNTKAENKIGLPNDFNPFDKIKFSLAPEEVSKIRQHFDDDVNNSKLPVEVKDRYSDKDYDQLKPFRQSLNEFIEEYDLGSSTQKAKTCALVLRNSDYANPDLKLELIQEIFRSWKNMTNVMFIIAPILAQRKYVSVHGISLVLKGDFGETYQEKLNNIIVAAPYNVFRMMKANIISPKMGPLLYHVMQNNENVGIIKYLSALLVNEQLPVDFKQKLNDYINDLKHDSFYLNDLLRMMREKYAYGYLTTGETSALRFLIKGGYAKHAFKTDVVKKRHISKISNNVLPKKN